MGSLVRSYGGWQWKPAIVAAERHALKCAAMGGKWIRLDSDFSGLHHFLKLSITHQYISDNAWQQYLTYDNNGETKQLSVQDLDPSATSSVSVQDQINNPTSNCSSRAKAKSKRNAAAMSKSKAGAIMNEEQEEHSKDGKSLQQELTKANKYRAEYRKVVGKAEQLMRQIKTDSCYSDINNDANLGQLEKLHATLLQSLTPFGNILLVEEWTTIKQSIATEQLIINLRTFNDLNFAPLAEFTAKVLRRRAA